MAKGKNKTNNEKLIDALIEKEELLGLVEVLNQSIAAALPSIKRIDTECHASLKCILKDSKQIVKRLGK